MVNNDREISQREAEINEIAKSIFQLADLFKDIQNLVVDQGTMLDRIDYNIAQTVTHVTHAHKELVLVGSNRSIEIFKVVSSLSFFTNIMNK